MVSNHPFTLMRYSVLILIASLLCGTVRADSKEDKPESGKDLPQLIYRSNGVYSILEAAAAGNLEVMKARIEEGCDVNQIDEKGFTALHLAAMGNETDCLQLMLKSGADPMIKSANGKIAAQLAKSKKTVKAIKGAMALRQKEIELCAKVAQGDMESLREAMKKKGFNPNMLNEENNQSLLILVCRKGTAQDVQALLKAGANVNYVDPRHRSVLHNAVDTDNAEIITTLLEAGANPMAKAGNEAVPMHDAVWSRRMNSIKALMPAYKDINYSPPGGFNGTPIGLAIGRNFPDVVQLFIDAGIDLNDPKAQNPPLVQAARDGKADIVRMLLKAGASKTVKNRDGQTAADVANPNVKNLL